MAVLLNIVEIESSIQNGFIACLIICLSCLPGRTVSCQPGGAPDYYRIGMEAAEQGKPELALKIWLQGKIVLEEPDPRIGFAFLDLVAEHSMAAQYETACYMYQWSFSGTGLPGDYVGFKQEIMRLKPIAGVDTYKKWTNMLERDDPSLFDDIRQFWQIMDPTPTTGYNERLIEYRRKMTRTEQPVDLHRPYQIPMYIHQYRLLDESGNHYLATFVESRAGEAVNAAYFSGNDSKAGGRISESIVPQDRKTHVMEYFQMFHHFEVFDDQYRLVDRKVHQVPLRISRYTRSYTVMAIPYASNTAKMVFTAQLKNEANRFTRAGQSPYRGALIGVGKKVIEPPEPLSSNDSSIMIGDPIVGFGSADTSNSYTSFTVAHDRKIPVHKDIVVHLEYYLSNKENGDQYLLRVNSHLEPYQKGDWWNEKLVNEYSPVYEWQSKNGRIIRNIQISTDKLRLGKYRLNIKAAGRDGSREISTVMDLMIYNKIKAATDNNED